MLIAMGERERQNRIASRNQRLKEFITSYNDCVDEDLHLRERIRGYIGWLYLDGDDSEKIKDLAVLFKVDLDKISKEPKERRMIYVLRDRLEVLANFDRSIKDADKELNSKIKLEIRGIIARLRHLGDVDYIGRPDAQGRRDQTRFSHI